MTAGVSGTAHDGICEPTRLESPFTSGFRRMFPRDISPDELKRLNHFKAQLQAKSCS